MADLTESFECFYFTSFFFVCFGDANAHGLVECDLMLSHVQTIVNQTQAFIRTLLPHLKA